MSKSRQSGGGQRGAAGRGSKGSSSQSRGPSSGGADRGGADRGGADRGGADRGGANRGGADRGAPSSRRRTPQASIVKFKAALRKEKRKRAEDPEIDYLNITAMLDLMTIILVFLLQTMASSAASVQEGGDLRLSRSVMSADPAEEGVILIISKTAILLGEEGDPILTLPSRAQLAQQGLDARHKRSGPNDLYIVPLANRLRSARDLDKKLRAAKKLDPSTSEAIIIADATTPYRLLIEVLFTLGQSEFGKYHLMVMRKDAG